METLADRFVSEQARVREILGYYKEIGRAGLFGVAVIEQLLYKADKAAMDQDTIAMLSIVQELQAVK